MTQILGGLSAVLLVLLAGLGYLYKGVQSDLAQAQGEIVIKEQSINSLKDSISHQNDEIDKLKIDVEKKQIVYKDRVKVITKTVEVEKQSVANLQGKEDCDKAKDIANEIFSN